MIAGDYSTWRSSAIGWPGSSSIFRYLRAVAEWLTDRGTHAGIVGYRGGMGCFAMNIRAAA